MRMFVTATVFGLLAACGPTVAAPGSLAATQTISAPAEDTKLIAVMSYASWCPSCKALDPKVTAVLKTHTFEGVEFFALDYSARDDEAYFAMADTIGVGHTMRDMFASGIATGRMYLIDRDSGAILGQLTRDMNEAAMADAIKDARDRA